MVDHIDNIFLQLFCEKNSDGTKKLRLKGKELDQRIGLRLCDLDMYKVADFIMANSEITEVNLSYNEIGDEGVGILSEIIFSQSNTLEHLNLMHNDITEVGMENMFDVMEPFYMRLKTLRLAGNKLGAMGGYYASLVAENCPELEYFDVGDTDQTPDSLDGTFLALYRSNIKVLNISRVIPYHMFYQDDNKFLSDSISTFLYSNNTIVELHVQKSGLEAHDMETLIEGLENNTSLKFLDIGYNHICCVGVEILSEWLKTRPSLLALNIAGNQVKNHGATALSFAMPFSKLRMLDISYNLIENEGIIAILNSIKKPYMLRYFYLWGNKFSHPANKIIKRMVASTVFEQENIDVKIYCVDDVLYAARYPADKYKHRYYDVMDHGCRVELKIKRNRIEKEGEKPRSLIKFQHIDRYPPLLPKIKDEKK